MDNVFNFWLGVIVIFTVGTLAHFLYDWTHQNKIVGLFAAVNESTWEHIKIALTPTLLWSLYDGFIYGMEPNYFLAKLASLLVITILIPLLFYAYQAFTKKEFLIADIAIFYLAILFSQLIFYALILCPPQPYFINYLSSVLLFAFFGCYMTLTLEPLKNFLFQDPITKKYGFYAHRNLKRKVKSRRQAIKSSKKS